MKRIYLCGPISGRPEQEYEEHFAQVEAEIKKRAAAEGIALETVSPPSFPCRDMSWEDALKYCIKQLVDCDGIAALQGWSRSRGCLLELEIAGRLKIPVVHIQPPADEYAIEEFFSLPIHSDILRYYTKRYFEAERVMNPERIVCAGDIALLETVNRYLDPYGFEYREREHSQEEKHGTV
jgi:hypothetical protein